MATVLFFSEAHLHAIRSEQALDTALQEIIEQRAVVAMAREDVEKRPGAYNLNLVLQQEKQKLARLLEARWAKFGVV